MNKLASLACIAGISTTVTTGCFPELSTKRPVPSAVDTAGDAGAEDTSDTADTVDSGETGDTSGTDTGVNDALLLVSSALCAQAYERGVLVRDLIADLESGVAGLVDGQYFVSSWVINGLDYSDEIRVGVCPAITGSFNFDYSINLRDGNVLLGTADLLAHLPDKAVINAYVLLLGEDGEAIGWIPNSSGEPFTPCMYSESEDSLACHE